MNDSTVSALDRDAVSAHCSAERLCALQQMYSTGEEVRFKRSGNLRVLQRKNLLTTHNECDLTTEGLEHMNKFNAGDT